jgi:acyl-coenzyme A thioesterase PaaI-like protein
MPPHFKPVKGQSIYSEHLGPIHVPDEAHCDQDFFQFGITLEERHTGGRGRGHGGVTMTFLDEAMGRAASETCQRMCVTLSMTTHFLAATHIGDFICASVKVRRRGQNIVFVDAQLHAGERLLATASGTWKNTRQPIPGR